MFCYADEEYGVCLFADIAVAGQGCCFRLARSVAGGDDEEAACVKQGLQVCWDGFIHGSCQYEDDFTFPLQQEMEHILF